jgi:putative transposase
MGAIAPGMVLAPAGNTMRLSTLHRVIKVFPDIDKAVLIEIPSGPRYSEGNKQPNYYSRGLIIKPCSDLLFWKEDTKEVVEAKISLPALWYCTDEEIRRMYPPRGTAKETSMIARRTKKLDLIAPLIEAFDTADFDRLLALEKQAAVRARALKISKVQVLDALHRYLAFGCFPNALLTNSWRQGAPGVERIPKERKAGRKNAAAKAGNDALAGKILTEEDRKNLKDGWAMYVRPGTPVAEAFIAMSGTFYSEGYSQKNGLWTPNLLDAHQRPTLDEFRYHGPKGDDMLGAARRLMGEGVWARDYRPLLGSASDGVAVIGQVGSVDASPIDVNLNAIFGRLRPIGVGRGLFVRDVRLGMYFGSHVAIGGIGTEEVNLALLDAATDKAALLRRYGLTELDPDGIPSLFFTRYLSDNGELRSLEGINAAVEQLGSRIEFIQSHRADRNSVSESGHHSRHRGIDHHLDGTTRGRQAKRGEQLPITRALLTRFEYVRLLLLWIYWVNTRQQVPHLLNTELRRAGVEPTRIAIYRWAQKNGRVGGKPMDPTFLQAKLMPTFTASIQRNGIVLHRPTTGNAVELLPHARFYDDYLATSGLIRAAVNGNSKYLQVKANPEDLSKVLLVDNKGIHVLRNTSDDVLILSE